MRHHIALAQISEASRRLPQELKVRRPAIEWQETATAGDFYHHEYEDVAARRMWDTLIHHLPAAVARGDRARACRPRPVMARQQREADCQ
jgi:uncharacterized protein with HEPN domain